MTQFLTITEIIVSILLMLIILIQNKNVTLNLTSMGWWMWPVTKRGPEKVLHNTTIVLSILFILNSLFLFLIR